MQEVGLDVSKMDAIMYSAGATGGTPASGEPHAGQVAGQQPRLTSWSEMLERGFSMDHLPHPGILSATDRTTAFMHATFGSVASLKMLYNGYAESSPSLTDEVQQLRHELVEEKKNTMRLEREKIEMLTAMTAFSEKAEAHLV